MEVEETLKGLPQHRSATQGQWLVHSDGTENECKGTQRRISKEELMPWVVAALAGNWGGRREAVVMGRGLHTVSLKGW